MIPIKSTEAFQIVTNNIIYASDFCAKDYQEAEGGCIPIYKALDAIVCAEQEAEERYAKLKELYDYRMTRLDPFSPALSNGLLLSDDIWEQRRYDTAQELFIAQTIDAKSCCLGSVIAELAVGYTDDLINELKKEK